MKGTIKGDLTLHLHYSAYKYYVKFSKDFLNSRGRVTIEAACELRLDKAIYRNPTFGFVLLFFNPTPLSQLIKRPLLVTH